MFLLAGFVADTFAADIVWTGEYTISTSNVNFTSLNSSPNGDYFISFLDLATDRLESCILDGTSHFATIAQLGSDFHAPNAIDFNGYIPTAVFNNFSTDVIQSKLYDGNNWSGTVIDIPDSSRAWGLRIALDGPTYYIAFCALDSGTSTCKLKLATNVGGSWRTENVAVISETNINYIFDISLDSGGTPHFAFWDQTYKRIRHAKRVSNSTYTVEDIETAVDYCRWLEIDFISPDIPMVGFLDSTGTPDKVRLAYAVASTWGTEEVYSNSDIAAVDMGLDRTGDFITPNIYFVLYEPDGYSCINRVFPGWNATAVNGWNSLGEPDAIHVNWNLLNSELGVVLDTPDVSRLSFFTGEPSEATPTRTPTPTPPTPTPTPTGSPTGNACSELYTSISMPSTLFHAGDPFYCSVIVCNPDAVTYPNVPLFVILDVYGQFFFAPSFSNFDYIPVNLIPGPRMIEIIPEFTWPVGVGAASNIHFYAAMTNPEMTDLFGTMDSVSFGWE